MAHHLVVVHLGLYGVPNGLYVRVIRLDGPNLFLHTGVIDTIVIYVIVNIKVIR